MSVVVVGYYMRYIAADDQHLSLETLDSALKSIDPNYAVKDGELRYGSDLFGEIEINRRGEEFCDAEVGELCEFVDETEGTQRERERVLEALRNVTSIVAVRVLWQGREPEQTLSRIDPLWTWLLANRPGLMQADGEGYYDSTGLVLSVH